MKKEVRYPGLIVLSALDYYFRVQYNNVKQLQKKDFVMHKIGYEKGDWFENYVYTF